MSYTASASNLNREMSLRAIDLCVCFEPTKALKMCTFFLCVFFQLHPLVCSNNVLETNWRMGSLLRGRLWGAAGSWGEPLPPEGESLAGPAESCRKRGARQQPPLAALRWAQGSAAAGHIQTQGWCCDRSRLFSTAESSSTLHSLKCCLRSAHLLLLANEVCTWSLLKLLQTVFLARRFCLGTL